jgi:hypothetical protein
MHVRGLVMREIGVVILPFRVSIKKKTEAELRFSKKA